MRWAKKLLTVEVASEMRMPFFMACRIVFMFLQWIEKVSMSLFCGVLQLVEKALIACHVTACHYVCQSVTSWWTVGHSSFWLWRRVHESQQDLTWSITCVRSPYTATSLWWNSFELLDLASKNLLLTLLYLSTVLWWWSICWCHKNMHSILKTFWLMQEILHIPPCCLCL